MFIYRKIKIGNKELEAFQLKLGFKNLIVIKGSKGYVMCGYLNMRIADKFKDVAVKITGVATISQAMRTRVFSCSREARRMGIYKGQPLKDVLKIIA